MVFIFLRSKTIYTKYVYSFILCFFVLHFSFGFFIATFNCHRSFFLAGSCFFWRILKNNKCIFSYMVLKLFPSLPPRLKTFKCTNTKKKSTKHICQCKIVNFLFLFEYALCAQWFFFPAGAFLLCFQFHFLLKRSSILTIEQQQEKKK